MLKGKIKVLCIALVMVLAVTALVSCSNQNAANNETTAATQGETTTAETKAAEPIKFTFATWSDMLLDARADKQILDKFQKDNNVTIEVETIGDTGDFINKIKVLASTNSMPDLFHYWVGTALDPLVSAKAVLDVTDYMDDEWKGYFQPGVIEWSSYNNRMYVLPYEKTILGYFVNESLFEKYSLKVPTTYDELKAAIPILNKNGIVPIALGSKDAWSTSWMIDDFYARYDNNLEYTNKILAKQAKFADNPEFKKGLEKLYEMAKLGAFPKNATSMTYDQAKQLFYSKKAAIISSGTWLAAEIEKGMAAEDLSQVEFMQFPAFSDSQFDQKTVSQNYAAGFGASASLEVAKKDMAIKFLKYTCSPEAAKMFMAKKQFTGFSVPVDEAVVGALFAKCAKVGAEMKGFKHSYFSFPAAFQGPYYNATQEICAGLITPEQFLKKLDDAVQKSTN